MIARSRSAVSIAGVSVDRRQWWMIAALLFGLTFAKGMAWVSFIPIAQQPDEPAHAAFAAHLARTGDLAPGPRPPTVALDTVLDASGFHTMVFRPWSIGAMDDASLDRRESRMRSTADNSSAENGEYSGTAVGYPPLYYAMPAVVARLADEQRFDRSWLLQRAVSVLLASLAIVVQFAVLTAVFGGVVRAGLASLTLTMMPMYTALQAAINPEVLLVLLGSLAILYALRVARDPYRFGLHLVSGAILAAALLTKPNGIVFLVPYFAAVAVGARTAAPIRWKALGARVAGWFVIPLLVYGAWRAVPPRPDARVGSDPLDLLPSADWTLEGVSAYARFLAGEGRYRISDLYWGGFGWVDAPMPSWSLVLGLLFTVATFIVVIIRVADDGVSWWLPIMVSSIAGVLAMLLWVEFGIYSATGTGMIQGRYFFPVVVAIVALQMWGVDQAFRARPRLRTAAWVLVPTGAVVLHVVAVFGVVLPRYYL